MGHRKVTQIRIVVLGAAAGGGYPQWNCNCAVCSLFWQGDRRVTQRTQSSIAVTGDDENWVLINCSPDVRSQIMSVGALHPRGALRQSPITGIVLTNGDIDHVAGLLSLRESQPFSLFATRTIMSALADNPMFSAVDKTIVPRHVTELGGVVNLPGGLSAELFAVPGKVPLYLEQGDVVIGAETETTIGLKLSANGASFFYVPGCAALPENLANRLRGAQLVMFDGTLWDDEEMIKAGVGHKTGRRMGHMSMSGPDGSIAALSKLDIERRIFIHINNTNPVLVEGSEQKLAAEQAGWQIAYDGMEIEL